MKNSLPYLLAALVFSPLSSEALTHKEAVTKKVSYLSHFQNISGSIDIEDGVLNIRKDLRIQSNKAYIENLPDIGMRLVAHGNVMVNYRGKTLVCDYLEYYEDTDTCLLTNGRFALYPWHLGGSTITINPDTLIIHKGYISTSEGDRKHVCLSGDYLEYSADNVLSIGKTTFSICRIPLLVLPQVSIMPMEIPKPPINFRGGSGGFLGSYLGISYALISKNNLSSVFFLDSFFKHGIGLGYNMRVVSKNNPNNALHIKSYYAHRLAIDMKEARDRYRLHGDFSFTHKQAKLKGECHLSDSWETVADIFPNNFSLKNTGPTRAQINWRSSSWESQLVSSVKVNTFQNVKQELPYLLIKQYPLALGRSRIMYENLIEGGYLHFAFSSHIPGEHFSSLRASIAPKIYRSFSLPIGTCTPTLSGKVIYYGQTPETSSKHVQAVGSASLDYRFTLQKNFLRIKHTIEPFVVLTSTTTPLAKEADHYLFSIDDAYHSLHLGKVGFISTFSHRLWSRLPKPTVQFWSTHALNHIASSSLFPKTACKLSLPLTIKNHLIIDTEWIWKKHRFDHFNILWECTHNENLALALEFLHRSKYGFIKCDHDNYVLEALRSEPELLDSPLSDRRNLVLAKLFARPHPCWNYNLTFRYGWHRTHMPSYLEYQITIGSKIFEHWQLYSVYEKREADKRVFFYLKLDKPAKASGKS